MFVPCDLSLVPCASALYNSHVEDLIRRLLLELGEDPGREGLARTPLRVSKAMKFLTSGYGADIDAILNDALFTVDYSEMVIVKDIDFYSLCEHHLLPFFGKCHVAYIPRRHVIGLSKIPRLVDVFARRLQIQERMTNQIAQTILEKIDPLGVAVVCEGTHLCMSMRGVEKQNSFAVTSAMLGIFRDNARTRMEFLELITSPERRAAGNARRRGADLRQRLTCAFCSRCSCCCRPPRAALPMPRVPGRVGVRRRADAQPRRRRAPSRRCSIARRCSARASRRSARSAT